MPLSMSWGCVRAWPGVRRPVFHSRAGVLLVSPWKLPSPMCFSLPEEMKQ